MDANESAAETFAAPKIDFENTGKRIAFTTSEGVTYIIDGSPNARMAQLYALMGLRIFPIHSARPTEDGFECSCTAARKWRAERDARPFTPCPNPGKHPRVKAGVSEATTNIEQVRAWWNKPGWTDANIGIATDDKIWCLDIDGAVGRASLEKLEAEHGGLPQTWRVTTGSGGEHYYFVVPAGADIRNTVSALAPKVDVRGAGGYVIAPPSSHASGGRYIWHRSCAPSPEMMVPAAAPEWLVEAAIKATKARADDGAKGSTERRKPQPAHVDPVVLKWLQQIGDGQGQTGFHAPINQAACAYFAKFGAAADAENLKAWLIERIRTTTVGADRANHDRYLSDEYLDERIEGARAHVGEQAARAEADRAEAHEAWLKALEALSADTPEDGVQATWNLLWRAKLTQLGHQRGETEFRKKLKLNLKAWAPVRGELESKRRKAEKAEPGADGAPDVAMALPDEELVGDGWRYGHCDGRPWVYREDERLWTPWRIVGQVTYPDRNDDHGRRVNVLKEDGTILEFDIPADVAADTARLRSALALKGVLLTSSGIERLTGVAAQMGSGDRIKAYGSGGWREPDTYVTPWGTAIGPNQQITVAAEMRPKGREVAGTYDEWQKGIDAAFATGLRQVQLSGCLSYASCVLDLIRGRSGSVFLTGPSGTAKTTSHETQGSAWGDPAAKQGLVASLDVSAQAPEIFLTQFSGCGGCLDEVKHYKHSIQDLGFTISGDASRSRMKADTTGLRDGRSWRVIVTMSYEKPIEHRIVHEDGEEVFVGFGSRCLEIPSDRTKLQRKFLTAVEVVRTNFGHGGSRFVKHLIEEGHAENPQGLADEVELLADRLVKDTPTGDRRPARLMATIWRAGQLAQDAGLIPVKFPITPPPQIRLPQPKRDGDVAQGKQDKDAHSPDAEDADERPVLGADGNPTADALTSMIVRAWRLSRLMESASSHPITKAVDALLRNLAMGRGVAHLGETARPDTHAVRMKIEAEDCFVIPMQHLGPLLDGSADIAGVLKFLRQKGYLLLCDRNEGPRTVEATKWKHVPGFGPGPAIVIPVKKVTSESS